MPRSTGFRTLLASLALALTAPAFAHPGHGRDGGSHELVHYFSEPEHLAPVAVATLAGVASAMVVAWLRRKV